MLNASAGGSQLLLCRLTLSEKEFSLVHQSDHAPLVDTESGPSLMIAVGAKSLLETLLLMWSR